MILNKDSTPRTWFFLVRIVVQPIADVSLENVSVLRDGLVQIVMFQYVRLTATHSWGMVNVMLVLGVVCAIEVTLEAIAVS